MSNHYCKVEHFQSSTVLNLKEQVGAYLKNIEVYYLHELTIVNNGETTGQVEAIATFRFIEAINK